MKIALFSDIHANLQALEAFLDDIDGKQVDAIYCLGDLIGYNVWPYEVISEVRKRNIATLTGNHDLKTKGYAYELVSDSNRDYLQTLPAHIKLEFKLDNTPLNVVMVHGSTRSIDEYVLEDLDEAYVLGMMNEANADVLCVGHSHKPYHRVIASGGGYKHIINTGSVGKPKDGNPKGGYVIVTLNTTSQVKVEFIRFDYDIEKAAKAVEESPLPNELAERLRNAF
jgi:putative phosphoesterase